MTNARFGSPVHLVWRFLRSVRSQPPPAGDDVWAESKLLPGECRLWRQMSGPDRRHAVRTARAATELLGGEGATDRAVLAAALLHDVGKIESGLGTVARAAVTAVALVVGEQRLGRLAGDRSRAGRYLRHGVLGADLLGSAGSEPLTIAWAGEHHRAPSGWSVPYAVGTSLKAADDD